MPTGGSGGILLSLVTESFAVRALFGSLAAVALAAGLVRFGAVQSSRARRLVLLAPVLTAAAAAVASLGEVYLPQLLVASGAGTTGAALLDLFGERGALTTEAGLDLLVLGYGLVVAVLLSRRAAGLLAVRRTLARAVPADPDCAVVLETRATAAIMGVRTPDVRLLARCPGGAFTTGTRRPVIVVDPVLLDELDDAELEGLIAHELAHVARRDTLLGAVVGIFRDLAFFLPPLHIAARWLGREQEESADELATAYTGRPVALASSILKVWDRSRGNPQVPAAVCAAVPLRAALPSGVLIGGPGDIGLQVITARVERLIARLPAPSRLRRWSETVLALGVLALGTSAALTVPGWIATDLNARSLSFVYLGAPPEAPAESPAFATFRALAPAEVTAVAATEPAADAPIERVAGCPCVESQAQLAVGERLPSAQDRRLAWSSGRPAWEMVEPADTGVATTRPLWRLTESGSQVGFLLVGAPAS
jgi:Zn-dependent protease with chaperone function